MSRNPLLKAGIRLALSVGRGAAGKRHVLVPGDTQPRARASSSHYAVLAALPRPPLPHTVCGYGVVIGASRPLPCPQVWSGQWEDERTERPISPYCCSSALFAMLPASRESRISPFCAPRNTRKDTGGGDGVVMGGRTCQGLSGGAGTTCSPGGLCVLSAR